VSATTEGNAGNLFPWVPTAGVYPTRYQQIHRDLRGTPRIMNRLAWRRDGGSTFNTVDTHTFDCEVLMSHSLPYDAPSWVFANNYIGQPTVVVPRTTIVLGPYSMTGSPAPFELTIPLTTPFVYTGTSSLLWEVKVHSQSGPLQVSMDADNCSGATAVAPVTTGPGCVATGQTAPMSLTVQHFDRGGVYQLGGYVVNGPASAPVLFSLGTSNPNQAIPGLCSNLQTNLFQLFLVGATDATGFHGSAPGTGTLRYPAGAFCFGFPNSIGGATLYGQAHALDVGISFPIPIVNSNGASWTVPMPNTTRVIEVTRIYTLNPYPPTAAEATFISSSAGFGVVTEFRHN
jgi:hypothetical protein